MNEREYEAQAYPDPAETGHFLGTIRLKAIRSILVILVLGVLCIVLMHNQFGILLGLFMLGVSGGVWFFQKDQKVLDVYEDALFLFEFENDTRAIRLPVEEIKEWCVNKDNSYTVTVTTVDDQQFMGRTFQVQNATRLLNQVMPEKSLEHIRMEQMKKTKRRRK